MRAAGFTSYAKGWRWALLALAAVVARGAEAPAFPLQADRPGVVTFAGSGSAELFTREISASMQGALERDFVAAPDGRFPVGFLHASPPPQPWWKTMWTRDAGTFLRELVAWGYYQHACAIAQCIIDLAGTAPDGFVAFPRYFTPDGAQRAGTEMDGHAAIIIGFVSLWQRLPAADPFRERLYAFLHGRASPVRRLHAVLEREPLIPSTGEFGGGAPTGLYDNVVANNLCALALRAAAAMEREAGDPATAAVWAKDADGLFAAIETHLVDADGAWIWCIDPQTLRPDPSVLTKPANIGFGGLNGVLTMDADVLGFDPALTPWPGRAHSEKTFEKLLAVPERRRRFDQYGFWSQFDRLHDGQLTSPSYGQGYAIQAMLLTDRLAMAEHALDFLAEATYRAPRLTFPNGRLSPYFFYERLYSPDATGELATGCGPLNLVNVAEPLKVARLIIGVDDTSQAEVRIVPRLPPSWTGYTVEHWPIRTSAGVVRANLSVRQAGGRWVFHLATEAGQRIPRLAVRLPANGTTAWQRREDVAAVDLAAP